jgi:hypothetical protein
MAGPKMLWWKPSVNALSYPSRALQNPPLLELCAAVIRRVGQLEFLMQKWSVV